MENLLLTYNVRVFYWAESKSFGIFGLVFQRKEPEILSNSQIDKNLVLNVIYVNWAKIDEL